ncbi:MAG: dihydropteroate synthase [Gammaproteobacteria bacterium]|nr:dihydropteroate synthase [Gammaproteobacteria bacterium]
MKLVCGDRQLDLSTPQVMGILNATPDSFSDGGQFASLDAALTHARAMVSDGASIIDVGGESTRPGATPVSLQEELDRVIPVIEKIRSELNVCISVDSSSPEVFLQAKIAGAHMLNDVRALQRDGALEAAKATGLPVCLMHMQGSPETMQDNPNYHQIIDDVYDFLSGRIQACLDVGITKDNLLVDPGFGFGKTLDDNYRLLAKLDRFHALNLPLLIGLSRKSMIAGVLGNPAANERLAGSLAGAVISAMAGAHIIRVHDVKETADAMKVVAATLQQK